MVNLIFLHFLPPAGKAPPAPHSVRLSRRRRRRTESCKQPDPLFSISSGVVLPYHTATEEEEEEGLSGSRRGPEKRGRGAGDPSEWTGGNSNEMLSET